MPDLPVGSWTTRPKQLTFAGRIKFGLFQSSTGPGKLTVVTGEGNYEYGREKGECMNYRSLELFLRLLQPDLDDLFMFSLLSVNVVTLLEVGKLI